MNKSTAAIFFLVFSICTYRLAAQNFDINTLKKINASESSFKTNFFKADAQSVTVFNIAAPVSVFIAGAIKHNTELKKDGLYMAGAFVLSTAVTHITKNIVKRKRPFEEYSFIVKRSDGGGYSFPSGHTSAAFTTATSLSLYFPKWYVIVPSYLWASSVGYARMYQGVHYPTDVLAGAVVGAGSAWLAWKVQHWMDKKHTPSANSGNNKL
jgi:membrane-associated phospholipid phosphatase